MNTTSAPSLPLVTAETLLARLGWRYAVKKFDSSRPIPEATWSALERAMMLAPSSYGLQPWRFVVVSDPAVKARLPAVSWNQQQPKDCAKMVVFAARTGIGPSDVQRYVERIIEVRGSRPEEIAPFRDMMLGTVNGTPAAKLDEWTARQCYIALGFLLESCALLGVDACPMEGIDGAAYDTILGLDGSGFRSVVGCACGYRATDDWLAALPKVRDEADRLFRRI
jgi:nitroreductase